MSHCPRTANRICRAPDEITEYGDDTLCRVKHSISFGSPLPNTGEKVRGEGATTQLEVSQAFWKRHPEPRFGPSFSRELSPSLPSPSPTLGRGEPRFVTCSCFT